MKPLDYYRLCAHVFFVKYEHKIPDYYLVTNVRNYNDFKSCTDLVDAKRTVIEYFGNAFQNKLNGGTFNNIDYLKWCAVNMDDALNV